MIHGGVKKNHLNCGCRHTLADLVPQGVDAETIQAARSGEGVVMGWLRTRLTFIGLGAMLWAFVVVLAIAFWGTVIYFGVKIVKHAWGG